MTPANIEKILMVPLSYLLFEKNSRDDQPTLRIYRRVSELCDYFTTAKGNLANFSKKESGEGEILAVMEELERHRRETSTELKYDNNF